MAAERKDVRVALTFDFDGVRRLDRTRRGKSCSAISRLLRLDRYARPYLGPSRSVWRHSGVAGNEKRALDGGNAVREMFSLKSIQMVQGSVCIGLRACSTRNLSHPPPLLFITCWLTELLRLVIM
jgi:hypothetical protein